MPELPDPCPSCGGTGRFRPPSLQSSGWGDACPTCQGYGAVVDCELCGDTGEIPICWCAASNNPPCGGCETPYYEWEGETRMCIDCDGLKAKAKVEAEKEYYISPFTGAKT